MAFGQQSVLRLALVVGVFTLWISATRNATAQEAPAAKVDPARFEKQIALFETADKENPPAKGQVLFIGSSSIRLWDLKKSFPDLDALNRGFGGSQISDSVHFFPRIVQPYQPRQVVFYAGDNDLADKKFPKTPEVVAADFAKFVSLLHEHCKGTRLVFIAIKPSLARWNLIDNVRAANALIKAQCEKDPLLTYLDVDTPMLTAEGTPRPELFVKDGLHMTPEGYEVWAKALRPHLIPDQRATQLKSLYDIHQPWTPPSTLPEWEATAKQLRERVAVACGLWPMPEKGDLKPVIHGKVDVGDYTVERVYFQSFPGHYVSGSLYRPKNITGQVPVVLNPHGHWENGRFTHNSEDVAKGQMKTGAEQFINGGHSPIQARMAQLARMGCIVFHYDMIGVADSGPLSHRGGFGDADAALWLHNKLGLQTLNSIRAVDFVLTLPDVDPNRIAVTGASGGGTQTFLLTALDPRIAAAFPAVMVSTNMQGGCICENADYLRTGINNVAIAALFAPKPMGISCAKDWTHDLETHGYPELKQVYSLYGEGDQVLVKAFLQFPHNYNQVSREMMYDWFNAHLKLDLPSPVRQADFRLLTRDEMTVFNAEHPRPADTLDEPKLRASLRARDKAAFEGLLKGDHAKYQEVILAASAVLLPPLKNEVNVEEHLLKNKKAENPAVRNFVVSSGKARVPFSLLTPESATENRRVVLWLNGAGRSHLRNSNGEFEAGVQQLLSSGVAVASADLFLQGDEMGAKNLYSDRFVKASPSHVSTLPDQEYTGFIYGYNDTLLAERVRDIQAVVKALETLPFSHITLVGTGGAGQWVLLSRNGIELKKVDSVIVDVEGFSFAGIKLSGDPNMLPGALKYGGIGGLASVAVPVALSIYGVTSEVQEEYAPLLKAYQSDPGKLKTSVGSLTAEQILKSR